MHYIIGTQVLIQDSRVKFKPGATSGSRVRPVISDFKPGVRYTLYHIRKDEDDKIRYVFISDDQTDVVGLKFDSPSDADKMISSIKGDTLPDYKDIYSRNSS